MATSSDRARCRKVAWFDERSGAGMNARLGRFLGGDALAHLGEHARWLGRLQSDLHKALDSRLADHCSVANVRAGVLIVHARNNSVGARLQLMRASLLTRLQRAGHPITGIRVTIRPLATPTAPVSEPRLLGAQGAAALTRLADSLPPDDPLRATLTRLIRQSPRG